MSRVWTVKTLSLELQRAMDRFWPHLEVEGEVAQIQVPASGHCYLVLREGDATLGGVVWRSHWQNSRFKPKRGDRVKCRGRLGFYEPQSKIQIYVKHLEPAGEGWLAKQIRERIDRLRKDGLLDPGRKRPLPRVPGVVAVATSLSGAALQDFLRVSRQRFPAARIVVAGCKVQGTEAPASVVRALELIREYGKAEVVVVTRGGGSKEDLLPFMDERLARAMAAMPIPVVSAVGHEIDTTIADMVADAVAATPSAAAVKVLPEAMGLARRVDDAHGALTAAMTRRIARSRRDVDNLRRRLRHPADRVRAGKRELLGLHARLERAMHAHLERRKAQTGGLHQRLHALSPLGVLDRGYAIVEHEAGVLRSIEEVHPGDPLTVRVADGTLAVQVTK